MGPKLRGVQLRKEQLSVRGNVRWRDNVQLVLIQQTSMHVSGTNPTFLERILIECRQSKTKVITTFDLCTCSIGEKGRESEWRSVGSETERRGRFGSTRPKLLSFFRPPLISHPSLMHFVLLIWCQGWAIASVNQKKGNNKPSEARENACGQIVIGVTLNLIGLEDGVGVLNQSQSEVKQTKKKS